MTFKDLKKRVTLELTQQQSKLSERLYNKPYWIWSIEEHKQEDIRTNGDCCFNHIIGLPQRDGNDKPLTALRTAVDNDGALDKESTSYNDIFDAFRLALKFYHFEESR